MSINVLFFARYAEAVGFDSLEMEGEFASVDAVRLGHHDQALAHHGVYGLARQAAALVVDAASGQGHQAADGPQRGAFAGTVGPDQRHPLAGVDVQVELAHGADAAIGHVHVADVQQGRRSGGMAHGWALSAAEGLDKLLGALFA